MKKNKMDVRGISPVIATILLIAATVAAGTIIAVYVSSLYVSPGRVIAGDIDGNLLDRDNTAGEDFLNENVVISLKTTTGYLRATGDSERGLQVVMSSDRRGWGPITADVRGQTNYASGYISESGIWNGTVFGSTAPAANNADNVYWYLYVPVRADGRLEEGTPATLKLFTYGKPGIAATKADRSALVIWDEDEDIRISVSCYGESFSTAYGTVRLYSSNWVQ